MSKISKYKKKVIKIVSVLMASFVLIIGTSGCSSIGKKSSPKDSNGVIQLEYWNMWSGAWENLVKKQVAEFNATHPKIHVNVLSIPTDGNTKLLTAIVGGNPPDVFTEWSPYIGQLAEKHALMPLNQFMKGNYKGVSNWMYPVAADWGTYKGKLYGLPWTMNSFMLYYNKTLMKEAGLDPNNPPKTVDQFFTQQSKLWKYKKGAVQQMGFYANNFIMLTSAWNVNVFKNGKYYLKDNPQALALMNWIAKYKRYPFDQVSGYLQTFTTNSVDPFSLGKEAFYINGMWEMPQINTNSPGMKYGVVPIPPPSNGYPGTTWVNGNYNLIPTGAKHPQAAWTFITWLSGYGNEAWAAKNEPNGGWIPASPKITAQPAYQKWLNEQPLRKPFVKTLENPHDSVTPVTTVTQIYEQEIGDAVNDVLQGKKTPRQALAYVEQQCNLALKTQQTTLH